MSLKFRVLGPLEVWDGERRLALRGPLHRALLATLLLEANRVVPAERLIDELWPEQPPKNPSNALQLHVSRLRRDLQGAGDGPGRPPVLETLPAGYLLHVERDALDLDRFRRLVDEAKAQLRGGVVERAADGLRAALALWRGPALADAAPGWTPHPRAVQLEGERLAALEVRIAVDLRLGRHVQLVPELEALVARHPLREHLCEQLMLALYRSGRRAEALAAYRSARRFLVEELGVEPAPSLQRLEQAILSGDPALEDDRAAPAAAQPAVQPAPAAGAARELPPDIPDFTGREEVLARVRGLLGRDQAEAAAMVIIAVTGKAGVGKTALAVHLAHRLSDRFSHGQLYVNLQGYASTPPVRPIQALSQLLRALGVEPDKVPVDVEEAAGLYRSLLSGRRVLVLLDNAASAEQVRPLLPGSPGCAVVVTSRDRLGGLVASHSARQLTLDVLTPAEAVHLLGRILGEDRVAAEPDAAAELARLCGHLPLALRIAAANLTCHPEESVAGHVSRLRSGDLLAALGVEGDQQAAVRVAFDLSYQRLAPDAQRLFRLLGLLPGSEVTTPAAAALAAAPAGQAELLLERLASAHLLEPRGVGRSGLHDLLRLYARERAGREEGESERRAALERLLTWYLHGADRAAGLLYPQILRLPVPAPGMELPPVGFDSHAGALAWLEAERANLVAAVQHAAEAGPGPLAWLLADTLRGYFWLRRHLVDWLAVGQAGLAAAVAEGDQRAQAAMQLSLGSARMSGGRYQCAAEHYGSALTLARRCGWIAGQAAALGNLGSISWDTGRLERAADYQTQALALQRQSGGRGGQAVGLANLSGIERELGRLRQAVDHATQALAVYREIGSRDGEAVALNGLGELCYDLGLLDQAAIHLTSAMDLNREVGNRYSEATSLRILAAVRHDGGDPKAALELGQTALTLAGESGERRVEAESHNTLASIELELGHPDKAIGHHRQALVVARQIGSRYPEAVALVGLAAAHQRGNESVQAIEHAEQAIAIARQAGYRVLEGQAHTALAAALLAQDRHDQAADHAERALILQRQTGHRLGRARSLVALGHALRHTRGVAVAMPCWREALALLTDIGSPQAEEVRALLRHAVRPEDCRQSEILGS